MMLRPNPDVMVKCPRPWRGGRRPVEGGERPAVSTENRRQQRWHAILAQAVFVLIALASMYGVFRILRPFFNSIILAIMLGSVCSPLHAYVFRRCGSRGNLAALLSVIVVFFLILVPSAVFLGALVTQGMNSVQTANQWLNDTNLDGEWSQRKLAEIMQWPPVARLETFARERVPMFADHFDAAALARKTGEAVVGAVRLGLETLGKQILPLLSATGSFLTAFFIMLFVMFYVFRDGPEMLRRLRHLSPLSSSQEEALLQRVRGVIHAVLLGTFVTAFVQGVAGMIGFFFVGIPALFWGTMLGAASIVPVVGTALIWVPATGYLLVTGHTLKAIFLFVWGAGFIGNIDTLLKPMLMGGKSGMSSLVVFFAILGGIRLFGMMGVIYGPLIFGLCTVCLYIYEMENAAFLDRQDRI